MPAELHTETAAGGPDSSSARIELLRDLYRRQLEARPDDEYLRGHLASGFLSGTERVFRFYRPWLPRAGRLLDWGCRHAPDACLVRHHLGQGLDIDGCDVVDPSLYQIFFDYAGLRYQRLSHPYQLPYHDDMFDAVIASGVLEHVPMDYESLKDLYRVTKPGGRLVITYLPNRTSIEELRLRTDGSGTHHKRLYSRKVLHSLLMHSGFQPLQIGYQTQLDMLPTESVVRRAAKPLGHRLVAPLTSCICAIAQKVVVNF